MTFALIFAVFWTALAVVDAICASTPSNVASARYCGTQASIWWVCYIILYTLQQHH